MFFKPFGRKKDDSVVVLENDKKYIFCFKAKKIIEQTACDFYEHNKKCDENKDYFKRTHTPHTCSGAGYINDPLPLLNECDYCLVNHNVREYRLSDEAMNCLKQNK